LGENFRRDIARRAASSRSQLLFIDETSQTKVGDFDDGLSEVLLREEQVFWFDVPVDDSKPVAVDQSVENGSDDVTSLCLGKPFLLQDLVE